VLPLPLRFRYQDYFAASAPRVPLAPLAPPRGMASSASTAAAGSGGTAGGTVTAGTSVATAGGRLLAGAAEAVKARQTDEFLYEMYLGTHPGSASRGGGGGGGNRSPGGVAARSSSVANAPPRYLCEPITKHLGACDFSLSNVLTLVGPRLMMQILMLVLVDRPVLLLSSSSTLLTKVQSAIPRLVWPFRIHNTHVIRQILNSAELYRFVYKHDVPFESETQAPVLREKKIKHKTSSWREAITKFASSFTLGGGSSGSGSGGGGGGKGGSVLDSRGSPRVSHFRRSSKGSGGDLLSGIIKRTSLTAVDEAAAGGSGGVSVSPVNGGSSSTTRSNSPSVQGLSRDPTSPAGSRSGAVGRSSSGSGANSPSNATANANAVNGGSGTNGSGSSNTAAGGRRSPYSRIVTPPSLMHSPAGKHRPHAASSSGFDSLLHDERSCDRDSGCEDAEGDHHHYHGGRGQHFVDQHSCILGVNASAYYNSSPELLDELSNMRIRGSGFTIIDIDSGLVLVRIVVYFSIALFIAVV
jgi:hypothetical protein